jgi:hypothetical protein
MKCQAVFLFSLILFAATAQAQNQRDIAVRKDKETLADNDSWFYDDLEPALEEAARTKRPLMIVFR